MFGSEEPQQRSALGRTTAVIKRTTLSERVAVLEHHHPQMLVHEIKQTIHLEMLEEEK